MELSINEMKLITLWSNNRLQGTVVEVERRSNKEYDLTVKGQDKRLKCAFSAWLPLLAIHDLLNWHEPVVAIECDYPEMAMAGDWSGIRDTDEERQWAIFNEFVPIIIGAPAPSKS